MGWIWVLIASVSDLCILFTLNFIWTKLTENHLLGFYSKGPESQKVNFDIKMPTPGVVCPCPDPRMTFAYLMAKSTWYLNRLLYEKSVFD